MPPIVTEYSKGAIGSGMVWNVLHSRQCHKVSIDDCHTMDPIRINDKTKVINFTALRIRGG
jgi:hypothetical protein